MNHSSPPVVNSESPSTTSMPAIGDVPVPEQSLSSLMNADAALSENLEAILADEERIQLPDEPPLPAKEDDSVSSEIRSRVRP